MEDEITRLKGLVEQQEKVIRQYYAWSQGYRPEGWLDAVTEEAEALFTVPVTCWECDKVTMAHESNVDAGELVKCEHCGAMVDPLCEEKVGALIRKLNTAWCDNENFLEVCGSGGTWHVECSSINPEVSVVKQRGPSLVAALERVLGEVG